MSEYIHLKEKLCLKLQPEYSYLLMDTKKGCYPLKLNGIATEILELLTGQYPFNEIVEILAIKHHEKIERATELVKNFLESIKNLLVFHKKPINRPIQQKGSKEFYSPDSIVLELTHHCPNQCRHCFLNAGIGKEMDDHFLYQLIEQLNDYGVFTIQLTGGEPFSYRKIHEITRKIITNGANISLTTNGYFLNQEIKKTLQQLSQRTHVIQVSLDGMNSTHNSIRNKEQSFEKAVEFIRYAVSIGCEIHIATILIHQTKEEIEELCAYVKALGVKEHRLGTVFDLGRATENNYFSNNQSQKLEKMKNLLTSKFQDQRFKIKTIEETEKLEIQDCGAGYKQYKIGPDYKLYPCVFSEQVVGNLRTESMETIFRRNTQRFGHLLKPHRTTGCSGCLYEYDCSNCLAQAQNNQKKVKKCNWYEENIDKKRSSVFIQS